jgi:hypothetical protein
MGPLGETTHKAEGSTAWSEGLWHKETIVATTDCELTSSRLKKGSMQGLNRWEKSAPQLTVHAGMDKTKHWLASPINSCSGV